VSRLEVANARRRSYLYPPLLPASTTSVNLVVLQLTSRGLGVWRCPTATDKLAFLSASDTGFHTSRAHLHACFSHLSRTCPSSHPFLTATMSSQPPEFHEGGFDANWVSLVLLKNNWADYYKQDWATVAANIKKLAHNEPPYPLPSAAAGVYEVRLWAWKVFTLEKYALVDHPAELLSIAKKFSLTGKMLRDLKYDFTVGYHIGIDQDVSSESRELAKHAIWEWIELGKSKERRSFLTTPLSWLFGRKVDTKEKGIDTSVERSDVNMIYIVDEAENTKMREHEDDEMERLLVYKR
jgi:hypothetical protein